MIARWIVRLIILFLMGVGGWTAARVQTKSEAAPPVLPSHVSARPGRLTVIRAEAGSAVRWHVCPTAKPPDVMPLGDGKELVFVAAQPGRYELVAWSASGDMPSEGAACVVKVEPETPPAPQDEFVEQLRAAWSSESDPRKSPRRDLLAGVFRIAASDMVRRTNVRTVGELFSVVKQASKTVMPDDALPRVRTAIADELRRTLPGEAEILLDAPLRERCAAAFQKIADALSAMGE